MLNKNIYALFALILFAACSSPYRSGQTPDDVYYSPGKTKPVLEGSGGDEYIAYNNSSDDNYLRMKVQNRTEWSSLDDYDYWYDSRYYSNNYYSLGYYSPYTSYGYSPFSYSYYSPFGMSLWYSPFSMYSYYNPWNSWYTPYATVVYYKNPSAYYARPQHSSSLNAYGNRNYNNNTIPLQGGRRNGLSTNGNNTYNTYNNSGNRNVYNNTNRVNNTNNTNSNVNRVNNNNTTPVRTFNNNSSVAPRAISGGSTGGSISRPSRHP